MLKSFFINLARRTIRTFTDNVIVGKKMKGIQKVLYYEKGQHLVFLMQKEISYETSIQNNIREHIQAGHVVFDIGGNIGQYSLFFSELVGKNGKVYSFEPDFKNYAFLQFNKNMNQCDNINCLQFGVGNSDSEIEFFRETETGGRRSSFKKEFVGDLYSGLSETVQIKKFDTLLQMYGIPDFVKIDVEGFEDNVIAGLSADLNKTKFLIEIRETTRDYIFNYFNDRKYSCFLVDYDKIKVNGVNEIPDFANLLFIKQA